VFPGGIKEENGLNYLWELVKITFQTFTFMVTDLRYILIMALVFVLVHRQYTKILQYEQGFFRLKRINPLMETVTSLVYGIGGGMLATILFILLGVSVSDAGVAYLWLAALLLMFIDQRFLCFAYAGSLVSLATLLTGFPKIQIATLMALVAILHMVESFLIFVNGYHNASPMFFKHASGKVVGGFALRKFWPMPTIALVGVVMVSSGLDLQSVPMPDWWPLIGTTINVSKGYELVYFMWPFAVAAGYSDIALTRRPKQRARSTALALAIYSFILLIAAIIADRIRIFQLIATIMAPLGHEIVIILGQKAELQGKPIFVSPPDGVMVLDVLTGSQGDKLGLSSGDVIKRVNGIPVTTNEEFHDLVMTAEFFLSIDVVSFDPTGREIEVTKEFKGSPGKLGILLVPESVQTGTVRFVDSSPLQKLWQRIQDWFTGR